MKKSIAFILASAMMLSLAACSSSTSTDTAATTTTTTATESTTADTATEEAAAPAAADITIGYATKSSSSPFWVENIVGAEAAAADLGVKITVIGPPLENDTSGQIAVLEDMITAGCDAICVAPCSSVGVADVVEKAMAQDIPVIAVGDYIEGVEVTSTVTTDNYNAGWAAGEFIGEQIGGEGKVIIVNGMLSQAGGAGRRDGFVDYMAETYGDAVTVVEVTADWDDTKALAGFEAAYAANTDIVGGYCAWDGGALQMWQVLVDNGRDDVALCGFDCYETALNLMYNNDPMFVGDVAQEPFYMGYKSVETAYEALMGETVDVLIDTGATLITPETCEDYATTYGYTLVKN